MTAKPDAADAFDKARDALAGLTAWDALAALLRASYFGYIDEDGRRRRRLPSIGVEFATTLLASRASPAATSGQAPWLVAEVVEPVEAAVLGAKIAELEESSSSSVGRMLLDAQFWEFSPGPEEEVLQRICTTYGPHNSILGQQLGFGVDDARRLCAAIYDRLKAFLLDSPSIVTGPDGTATVAGEPTPIQTGVERYLTFTIGGLSMATSVEPKYTEAFINHLSLGFGSAFAGLLQSIRDVRDHPLLRYGDLAALASPNALATAVGTAYEGVLRATGHGEVAKTLRGKRSEVDAHTALCAALRPDRAWRNVRCIGVGRSFERDSLIVIDTAALAIEVKGVSVRTGRSALAAADAIVRRNLVEAADQARSFAAFLLERGSPMDAPTASGDRRPIAPADYSRVIPVVITLEDLRTISSAVPELRRDADRLAVWPLSLTDIAWYSEVLRLPARLLHYGLWRLRVSSHADVLHDESEWLNMYVAHGPAGMVEIRDRAKRAPPNLKLRLFDSSVQRGHLPSRSAVGREQYDGLLEILDGTRAPGWLEASLAILDLTREEWDLLIDAATSAMASPPRRAGHVPVESRVPIANEETVVHIVGAPYSAQSRREWQAASIQIVASAPELTTDMANHVILFPRDRRAQSFDAVHVRLANGRGYAVEWMATTGAQAKASGMPGRNDSCPCGSGRKYKKCCGA